MGIEAHIEAMARKHEDLETKIEDAITAPSIDDLTISDLKRKKLMLKDAIEKLKSES
ncbi:YdcH family protein [Bartonella tamiae]|uniref:DUF465 domain-containing protein n=1 Tax=Bartonella tamiae Th239 TaxID=1094558 RepID=J1K3N6_9HYPH|nr:DUF465 domain-containing protein [Bartonella tamiae]EJF91760.1 hypothetical protein ME5_00139 [Bartonella tamiae Th239]EJF92572.1 hypothetical protein MEG_01742 [Bartonella tamiae Th307]